ncbi:unnamed protein product [Urochloa humidicola]
MESAEDLAGAEQGKDDDAAGRLTYEIFSLVEAKVLFGSRDAAVLQPGLAAGPPRAAAATDKLTGTWHRQKPTQFVGGKQGYAPLPTPTVQAAEGDPCPRCESTDTKFCYYNTSQPRHFCKTCRRTPE